MITAETPITPELVGLRLFRSLCDGLKHPPTEPLTLRQISECVTFTGVKQWRQLGAISRARLVKLMEETGLTDWLHQPEPLLNPGPSVRVRTEGRKKLFVTASEYATLCGVDRTSIRDRIKSGTLEVVRKVGINGRVRILVDVVKYPPRISERSGQGGKRQGAGRKPEGEAPKVAFPVSRVTLEIADLVRHHLGYDSMTAYVEEAIRQFDKNRTDQPPDKF